MHMYVVLLYIIIKTREAMSVKTVYNIGEVTARNPGGADEPK